MSQTTILIVEDEAIVAADLAGKLRQLGYEVAGIVAAGEDAVAQAGSLRPELVLMDIQLEGPMDGIEAAQAIRSRHDVPVIYLTAHSDAATLARAKHTGPFGYILKPFEERELATQIELALYKHQADRQLREQREWLRVTLTSIGDAVIATDGAGCISFVNPVAESLTGWKVEDAMGRPVTDVFRIVNEQTDQPLEAPVARVLREGRTVALANHAALVTKNGSTVPVEDSAAPILDAAGQVIGAVLVFHDVTDKRRAEEELRTNEHRLRWALKGAGGGAWDWDLTSGETWWSQEMYELWGVEPGTRMLLENSLAPVHEEDRERLRSAVEASLADRADFKCEFRIRHAVRGERWMASYGRPVQDASDSSLRLFGISLDITEQKRSQEALERSNRELEQFAYVASHDLQEPLRAVVGFLQLLQSRYEAQIDEKGRHYIERSVKAGQRMQTLIRQLLTLSRVHTKGATFAPADLNQIVKDVLDNLQSIIREKNSDITCAQLPTLPIDAGQIQSLFQNLIINAVRYNESPQPIIEIGCQEQDSAYQFFVKDNGIGISSQFYERIFMVFQRLHTDREYPGTGLGLALCKKIVERHGGTIWVESQPQGGSTFHFTLPRGR
jgi:PAS domain S-box-containing protein